MPDDRNRVATRSTDPEGPFRDELFRELVTFLETAFPNETTQYILDNFNDACAQPGAEEYCAQEGIWMPPPEPEPDDDAGLDPESDPNIPF